MSQCQTHFWRWWCERDTSVTGVSASSIEAHRNRAPIKYWPVVHSSSFRPAVFIWLMQECTASTKTVSCSHNKGVAVCLLWLGAGQALNPKTYNQNRKVQLVDGVAMCHQLIRFDLSLWNHCWHHDHHYYHYFMFLLLFLLLYSCYYYYCSYYCYDQCFRYLKNCDFRWWQRRYPHWWSWERKASCVTWAFLDCHSRPFTRFWTGTCCMPHPCHPERHVPHYSCHSSWNLQCIGCYVSRGHCWFFLQGLPQDSGWHVLYDQSLSPALLACLPVCPTLNPLTWMWYNRHSYSPSCYNFQHTMESAAGSPPFM